MDLASTNLRPKVDALMDRFYGAGVASHPTIIEQINYLLFMRALSVKDDEYTELGITDPDKIVFDGVLSKYKWENLMSLNAEALFTAVQECFDQIPKSTTNNTVRLVFRNAHLKLYDKPTLRIVVHELDKFAHDMDEINQSGHRDIFGDMYEYLLSKLSQAGTSGQFRTPRHIIEFMVAVVAPKKGETILDPAVGTAGFLVKAFEYLQKQYTSEDFAATGGAFDKLTPKEQSFLYEHTFNGFDSDEDMIKFGMMNLYLHGLENAQLLRQNSLTDTAGNRDKYDVILANPPFSGKIDRDSVAQELQMNTGATEVLFLRYMLEHSTDQGRVGVIVPEGVLFNSSGAHTKIRQLLLENGLWCVVSLPAGVFNPYAGVKTSIVFFDKTRADKKEVLFAKIEHDGFSIGAQRRPTAKNDLPEILEDIKRYQSGEDLQQPNAHVVTHVKIAESKDHNLSGDRYKITERSGSQKWPMVIIEETIETIAAKVKIKSSEVESNGAIPVIDQSQKFITGYTNNQDALITGGEVVAFGDHTRAVKFIDFGFAQGADGIKILKPKERLVAKYFYYVLSNMGMPNKGYSRHWTDVKSMQIPLPSIEAQREIVNELDSYQKIIDAAQVISGVDELSFNIDENWPRVKVKELFTKVNDSWSSTSGKEFSFFVGLEDVSKNTGELIRSNMSTPVSTKIKFKKNDILYGKLRPNLNKVWCSNIDNGICSTDFLVLRAKNSDQTWTAFYAPYFRSKSFNTSVMQGISGANLPRVSPDHFMNIVIPNPRTEQLSELVAELENMHNAISANRTLVQIYEQKIKDRIAEVWGE